jgi:hypothetical protein
MRQTAHTFIFHRNHIQCLSTDKNYVFLSLITIVLKKLPVFPSFQKNHVKIKYHILNIIIKSNRSNIQTKCGKPNLLLNKPNKIQHSDKTPKTPPSTQTTIATSVKKSWQCNQRLCVRLKQAFRQNARLKTTQIIILIQSNLNYNNISQILNYWSIFDPKNTQVCTS